MKVKSIMNTDVVSCDVTDSLYEAARLMWNNDCGAVPVTKEGKLAGMVTDRDLCMAALLSNREASSIPVKDVMSKALYTCDQDDSLKAVHDAMRDHQVRRIPVVDQGKRLIGLVTLNDLAREAYEGRTGAAAKRQRAVGRTFASICEPYENGVVEEEE